MEGLWDTPMNTILFILLPIVTVLGFSIFTKKLLWLAPVVSTLCFILICIFLMPDILTLSEYQQIFWFITTPLHLIIVVILTVIVYVISYVIKKLLQHQQKK